VFEHYQECAHPTQRRFNNNITNHLQMLYQKECQNYCVAAFDNIVVVTEFASIQHKLLIMKLSILEICACGSSTVIQWTSVSKQSEWLAQGSWQVTCSGTPHDIQATLELA